MTAVCDWRGRGAIDSDVCVIEDGSISHRNDASYLPGWMQKLVDVCEQQLRKAYALNIGIVRTARTPEQWLELVQFASAKRLDPEEQRKWRKTFTRLNGEFDRVRQNINEGGFFIRLVEWLQCRIQRRWYVETYGDSYRTDRLLLPPSRHASTLFIRPTLPGSITLPAASAVLPFHTVSAL